MSFLIKSTNINPRHDFEVQRNKKLYVKMQIIYSRWRKTIIINVGEIMFYVTIP